MELQLLIYFFLICSFQSLCTLDKYLLLYVQSFVQSMPVSEGFTLLLDVLFVLFCFLIKEDIIWFQTPHERSEYVRERRNKFCLCLVQLCCCLP